MSQSTSSDRIASIDQFRGYAVTGMILVDFVAYAVAIPSIVKHNDNYLSYADTIIPNFLFLAGMSFRLTMLRRLTKMGWAKTCATYFYRSLILIFLSTMIFGFGGRYRSWAQLLENRGPMLVRFLKSGLWETFAIIGVTQLVILVFVPQSSRIRLITMFAFALGHAALCYWFNWGFVFGQKDNWMVQQWNAEGFVSWDGGFFGPLCWGVPMLAGTLAYDLVASPAKRQKVVSKLSFYGLLMAMAGYIISCPTRLYDVVDGPFAPKPHDVDSKCAASPFVPSFESLNHRSILSFFAEPPFIAPPPAEERLQNYWMMSKKIPTLSYILCSTGITLLFYSAFVWGCDLCHLRFGVFQTFGTNALMAYCVNEMVYRQIGRLVPYDSPLWYVSLGVAIQFIIVYLLIRYFEKQKIFVRL